MHILFIDESGHPPAIESTKSSPLFVLGGVIIPEDFWHKITEDMIMIKKKFSVSGEVKWRYFAPHNKNGKQHTLSHLSYEDKESFRSELFALLSKYKSITTLCVITNADDAYDVPYITTPDDLYWYSYKQITERFQYYLQDISRISGNKINGTIVCDHRAPNDDKRLQELHSKLLIGDRTNFSKYHNLIEGVFIAPSHLSTGIQLADLVAGAVLRKEKDNDERFFSQIVKTFRKTESGEIKGRGLIYFPKKEM